MRAAVLLPLVLVACARSNPEVLPGPAEPAPLKPHKVGASEEPGGPGKAHEWRMLRWRSADGTIPEDGLAKARAQRERYLRFAAMKDLGGISPAAWTERGPSNVGGRTRSLVIDPRDANRMIAGSVSGGLWESADRGTTWRVIDDQMQHLAIGCIERDPSNPDVLYAGTGEGTYNGDNIRGEGIYRSADNGATWQQLPGTTAWQYTMGIAISPSDPNLILAATRGGIRRSLDGGASWAVVAPAVNSLQVIIDPFDPTHVLAHATSVTSRDGHRVVQSTDSGATWQDAQTGLNFKSGFNARIEMAFAPSQQGLVYANCSANNGEIWRSTDGGTNWGMRTSSYGNPFGWYCNTIWVDPNDSNFLIVGSNSVYRSTDGGQSLSRIDSGYIMTQDPHPDVHRFIPDPNYGAGLQRLYIATDGGIYATDNITTARRNSGWYALDQGYRTTQYYGAAGHGPSDFILGGTQDNGTHAWRTTGQNTVDLTFGGDGGFCAVDASNPAYGYGEYVYAQIHRTTNGGRSANYIYRGIGDAGSGSRANFIAPFILDPNDQRRLLIGGVDLWRTNDARASRPSWSSIKPSMGQKISAIAVAPGDAGQIWVGHNGGQVYRTTNGTATNPTWTTVDDNGGANPFPDRYITRICVDPANPAIAWVALGGYEPDNVWRTEDSGRTWALAVGTGVTSLPHAPVNGLCRHPNKAGWLYAATDVGIWASEDGGRTWGTSNDGPANVACDEIVFMSNSERLLVATHGRGVWTADVTECVIGIPDSEPTQGSCNFVPFGVMQWGQRYQTVATRADLRGRSGVLSEIGFAACDTGRRRHGRIKVTMSQVPAGYALQPNFDANLPAPVVVLEADDWVWDSKVGWSWLGLHRGFRYDGVSDVVVEVIVENTRFSGGQSDTRRGTRQRLFDAGWQTLPSSGTLDNNAAKMAFSFGCPTISRHGQQCGGLTVGSSGLPVVGGSYTVRVAGGSPGGTVFFNFGLDAGPPVWPIELSPVGLPRCWLWHDTLVAFGNPAASNGVAELTVSVPNNGAVQGAKMYAQGLAANGAPNGLALTGYLKIVHGL